MSRSSRATYCCLCIKWAMRSNWFECAVLPELQNLLQNEPPFAVTSLVPEILYDFLPPNCLEGKMHVKCSTVKCAAYRSCQGEVPYLILFREVLRIFTPCQQRESLDLPVAVTMIIDVNRKQHFKRLGSIFLHHNHWRQGFNLTAQIDSDQVGTSSP